MSRNRGGGSSRPLRPATTPAGRENQLISLAYDLVEQRIRDGTATSQEVTHFLKLGSSREQLEQQRIEHENRLLEVKREAIESQKAVEIMYKDALNAMRTYSGQDPVNTSGEYDE
jgi:hypothetical protein